MTVAPEPLAISIARATLLGSFTVPESVTVLPLADTWISSSGMSCLRIALEPRRVGRHLDRVDPHLAGVVPDEERGRAQPLAVDQHFGRATARSLPRRPDRRRRTGRSATGFTRSAEPPLETEITRSAWRHDLLGAASGGTATRAEDQADGSGSDPPTGGARGRTG